MLDKNMELIFPTVILFLVFVILFSFLKRKKSRRPPCIKGWIPWFGAGYEFGRAPLEFIETAKTKYGPVFTVFALGNRMTFVTEEEGIEVFLKSKKVDFGLAVQSPVCRTASIPGNIFLALHEKLHIMLKGRLGTLNVHEFTVQLTEELHEQLENLGTHGTMDLNKLVRNWSKSKKWFLTLLEKSIPDIKAYRSEKDNSLTVIQDVLDIVEMETKDKCPNFVLLVLWASLSNAVPIAFWTLSFILSHPDIHKSIMQSISSVFGAAGKDKIKICEDELEKLLLIKWCILETIRLRAPGVITRKVVEPVKILNYTVPSGDLLMLSPFWQHRNPKYFPEPELFQPERWKKANLEKHAFLDCFMAFGSGKFQCPGRWFALLEIQVFIILTLYKYDFILLDPLPKPSFLHLLGVPQPDGHCRIKYKQRI
ncbi:24-hydroxycholesterol 7-alpha-hydroxylase isoform X3 [Ochotona curzoniae]|uniref:24-hydroxycholesterol 7-alpha-hydroxylase isoform X3 n=1 Tax=Ochotona curzoniae TaxID=130825 RepID=UPI001B345CEE|nr:24-hydroxycholesterol 7-alpha-hydroxylase isoform X3 [Ochotona curzoniae]